MTTRESRPRVEAGAATKQVGETRPIVTRTADRRIIEQARRALAAALAQGQVCPDLVDALALGRPDPDLIAAAGLVIEAGRSQ